MLAVGKSRDDSGSDLENLRMSMSMSSRTDLHERDDGRGLLIPILTVFKSRLEGGVGGMCVCVCVSTSGRSRSLTELLCRLIK